VLGRFVSKDPIGLLGGLHAYAYAPNPIGWVDPLGLKKKGGSNCTGCCDSILAAEGVVIGKHGDIRKIGGLNDSHHVYQDAAVKNLGGYNYNDAIAVSLQGRNADGSTKGTAHYKANRAQDGSGRAGTLGSETVVAFNSLKAAGLSPQAAKCATLKARGYLSSIGASAGSATQTPKRRRK